MHGPRRPWRSPRPGRPPREPGPQRVRRPERAGLACQDQEGRLGRILGVVVVAEDAPADALHHRAVPTDQGREGGLGARAAPRQESLDELASLSPATVPTLKARSMFRTIVLCCPGIADPSSSRPTLYGVMSRRGPIVPSRARFPRLRISQWTDDETDTRMVAANPATDKTRSDQERRGTTNAVAASGRLLVCASQDASSLVWKPPEP